jgi:hypothetical protein
MKSGLDNNWPQPVVPNDIVVETIADIAATYAAQPASAPLRLWSPPNAASIHGVLWFVSLQQLARNQFPDRQPEIVLDCGDRGDLAHAALREGLRHICFRGSPGMLSKLQAIAEGLGAMVEIRHPALGDE